jgi:hypothetical protein
MALAKSWVRSGAFKTAYNLKGQPDLLVVLLKPRYRATEIKKEIGYLKQLEALGIKPNYVYCLSAYQHTVDP